MEAPESRASTSGTAAAIESGMSNDHNRAHSFGYSAKCRKGHKFCGCTAIRDGHGVWCPVCGEDVSEDKSNTARK